MGRRSWIFFIYSKDVAKKIKIFCEKEDFFVFIGHYVLVNGAIETKEGFIYGNDPDITPALLTQSDGESIVREIVNRGILKNEDIICLSDISLEEVEDTGDGYKLKKATYITENKFFEYLGNESFKKIKLMFKEFKKRL